ncbi:MAG: DNA repair protein RecN [candidate division Zixibacteria bacterium]|nr:DNA repair protein RecN [candidate division Zixibacteria bacterium]
MLKRLNIQNIALVTEAELLFEPGMSVLTGETGAGKSVIVTALGLALGDRVDKDQMRHGADKAIVEATFDVGSLPSTYKTTFGEFIHDGLITVQREINRDGSSKVKINGTPSTLGTLRDLTTPVAEIVGQHANQMLMDEQNHLLFLDGFASLDGIRQEVSELFDQWQKSVFDLRRTLDRRDNLAGERELLLFQKNEIEKAHIRPGEEEELVKERKILDSARTLMSGCGAIQELLDGDTASVLIQIRQARRELDKMAQIDTYLEQPLSELADADYRIEDIRRTLEQYGASIADNPARIEQINLRLDELYALKKKYGGSEEAILKTLDAVTARLSDRPDTDEYIAELEERTQRNEKAYTAKAMELHELRLKAASYLRKVALKELAELAIDNGGFELEFLYEDDPKGIILDGRGVRPTEVGLERGRFLFSANPGEPLKSLVKTASGGEISRVLLALKAAARKNAKSLHSLLVFDEVDAGIGGQTAVAVGEKIKRLAEGSQMIVVTHLHQIARLATHHYAAEKVKKPGGRLVISVSKLDYDGVTRELSRMMALPEDAVDKSEPR